MRSRGSRQGDSNGNARARESNGGSVSRFHHCSRGFTGCMFYLCCILGLPCVSCGYGSEQPAEFFKWFTGSSLAIQELKFKITHSSNVGTQLQTSVHYYRVRWQTNAFFLQQEDSLADLNRKRLSGVSFAWSYYGSGSWILTKNVANRSEQNGRDRLRLIADIKRVASEALNLGIPNVERGTMVWEGDNFQSKTFDGDRVKGELRLGSDGYPAEVALGYELTNRTVPMLVTYAFGTNVGIPLPSRIRQYFLTETGQVFRTEVEILSATISTNGLSKGLFEFEPIEPPALAAEVVVSSGRNEIKPVFEHRRKSVIIAYVIGVGLATGAGVFFLLRRPVAQSKKPA